MVVSFLHRRIQKFFIFYSNEYWHTGTTRRKLELVDWISIYSWISLFGVNKCLSIDPHLLATLFNFIYQEVADFDTMEDANANNQQGTRQAIQSTVGRLTGDFTIDKAMKLASAYGFMTTNKAIGTDQDGEMHWKKICDIFIKRGRFAPKLFSH